MTTLYTKEEREEKVNQLIERVKTLNHEELVALNQLLDRLTAEYNAEQAAEKQEELS